MLLPFTHSLLGTWPATQACALTGNRTSDPLVPRLAHNPLSHTSQGRMHEDFAPQEKSDHLSAPLYLTILYGREPGCVGQAGIFKKEDSVYNT